MLNSPVSVLIALGSNLGQREVNIRRAIEALQHVIRIARLSSIIETDPVDAPAGSPRFLNMVLAGQTRLEPEALMNELLAIEEQLGRVRRGRNAPRTIDLDLILHSANVRQSSRLTLPHPRYRQREFVMTPLRQLHLPWVDPVTGEQIAKG